MERVADIEVADTGAAAVVEAGRSYSSTDDTV